MTIWMERFPLKTLPWVPFLACDACQQPVTLEGHVLWNANRAAVGLWRGPTFVCSEACILMVRANNAKGALLGRMGVDEFMALLLITPGQRAQVEAAAQRIEKRRELEKTTPHVKRRRKPS